MSEPEVDVEDPDVVDEDQAAAQGRDARRPVRRRGLGRGLGDLSDASEAASASAAPSRPGKGLAALIPSEPGARYIPDRARQRPAGFTAAPEPAPPMQVPAPAEPQPVEEPPRIVEVPPAVLAATLSAPRRVETEWLAAPELDAALHHADLGLHAVHDLALDEQHRAGPASAILLACGRITAVVSFPAAWQRTDADRCPVCSAAVGYPPGVASPVNDPACRAVLAARFGAIG